MNRMTIRIVNGALVVLCCFLAARTIATVTGEALAPPSEMGAVIPAGIAAPPQSWEERQKILDRNLFRSQEDPDAAQALAQQEDYEETQLPLRLLGTAAAGDPALARAAVEDLETRTHQVVQVGDVLKDRAQVIRIERRRLVLQNGPRREELSLADEEGDTNPRPVALRGARPSRTPVTPDRRSLAARAAARAAEIQRLGENRFALPRSDVESVANNPAALFSQARILPKYEEGEMVGVQLNAIKPGSIFEQIGIENGDTITEFNGIQVTGQQESAEVLRELTQATQFDVTVTGQNGQTRQLRYEIR